MPTIVSLPTQRAFVALLTIALVLGAVVPLIAPTRTSANVDTPQALPFTQNWANTGLITVDDDWSGVPGITGYRGDGLAISTGTDPQTVVADGSSTPVDVNANETNPNTFTTGGVAEFEIADPTVALQGSGTADAPHLVIAVNTTGFNTVTVAYVLRDVDGSADNAVQPVALQYRVGESGNYSNIAAGFVADASTGPSLAVLTTSVTAVLPADAANQAVVHVRVITADAVGSDEWIGIDDITITGTPTTIPTNQSPTITCPADFSTPEGIAAQRIVTASDPDGTVTDFSHTVEPASSSITLVNEVAESEDPPAPGSATIDVAATTPPDTYTVTVTATNNDPTPQSASCIIEVTVIPSNAPVVIDCGPSVATLEGDATTATVTASDADGTVTSIVIASPDPLPSGITFGETTEESDTSAASVVVTVGALTTPGTYVLTMEATNDDDAETPQSETCELTITVHEEGVQIWEIQGASHISPYNGDAVTGVDGIVTAVSGIGFWMTDPIPDGDVRTSDGIFVFRDASTKPAVGEHVTVSGTVSEFRPGGSGTGNLTTTQIGGQNNFIVLSTGNTLPVQIIGAGGRTPPTQLIHPGSPTGSAEDPAAGYDPATRGIDFYESLEGMYVRLVDPLAVGPRNRFGEIAVVVDDGANAGPFTARGGLYIRPTDFNPERMILDDVLAPTPTVNVGDEFTADINAVVDYGFGNYKFLVTASPVRVDNGLAREVTAAPATGQLAVATFNVENLGGTDPQDKYDALAAQIVNNLRAPDLIGIEEVTDNDGFANTGISDATTTWTRLIAAIAAAGGPAYQYRQIDPVHNADGGAPGANIRVGFLFRTDRGLTFVDRPGGTSTNETSVSAAGGSPALTFSPGRIGTDDRAFLETRKSLAGEFRFRGQTIFVVVNHFSSKNGDDPLFGRYQPPVRETEFADPSAAADSDGWRWGQAQVINNFVDSVLAADSNAAVIVLGDINDFHFSDTVRILTGEAQDVGGRSVVATGASPVLTTLFDVLPENERYSYVFDGNSQVLDQILVSGSVLARSPAYDVVHINSEFATQTSDHEPSVMRVALGVADPEPPVTPPTTPVTPPATPPAVTPPVTPVTPPVVAPPVVREGTQAGTGGPALPNTAVEPVDEEAEGLGVAGGLLLIGLAGALAIRQRRLAAPGREASTTDS